MEKLLLITCLLVIGMSGCKQGSSNGPDPPGKPNILLVIVDDLRPELNCYGAKQIHSPNIDSLASDGVLFTRAFTQQAVCAPSRNTLMTGMRPDGLGITDLATFFRTKAPDVVTLSQHFIRNGYRAEGMGKVYHTGHGNRDDSLSWTVPHWSPDTEADQRNPITRGDTTGLHTIYPKINGRRLPWLKSSMPEHLHNDAMVASRAIERMEALKEAPFILAVGLVKPHLPFVAPAKYWNMYDASKITVPSPDRPDHIPPYALANWGELRKYHGMPSEGLLREEDAVKMIHGYYACVSFIDAQVGRLVEKLKELGLYENTIIVFWGDHGWKLGEYGEWCKHTNFELDTRIPLIVRVPGRGGEKGWESSAIVETVDIYPTLCELAGLELPDHLQGSSFREALFDRETDWEDVAFSQFPRDARINGKPVELMGYSMRTDRYRLTRWVSLADGETLDVELYDHTDGAPEMANLAAREDYQDLIGRMTRRMEEEYAKEHGNAFLQRRQDHNND